MNLFRSKTNSPLLFILFFSLIYAFQNPLSAQRMKFKDLKSLNVGTRNDSLVKVMFTTPKEVYYYSTFKHVMINKVNVYRLDCKIRKSDSVCVEVCITTDDANETTKLLKLASQDFGAPDFKVMNSANNFDWVWSDKKYPTYVESKIWHNEEDGNATFKILLIAL